MSLSPQELSTLIREARAGAARLARRLSLPADHHDDLRQDLLLDLWLRVKSFDPRRGSLGAFAGVVVARRACRLAMRIRQERRMFVGLDESEVRHSVAATDMGTNVVRGVERRIDNQRAVALLHPSQRKLCAELADNPPPAHALAISRATRHRQLRDARLTLVMAGMLEAA